jgi:glycosyltransferase involved in cell wall biosynthesis
VANVRVPSERAHVHQIFKTCEAFHRRGLNVELVHPRRKPTREMEGIDDVFSYYQVEEPFQLREIGTPDFLRWKLPVALHGFLFPIQSFLFGILALWHVPPAEKALVYTRDFFVATVLTAVGRPFLFELHTLPLRGPVAFWMRRVIGRAYGIITITRHLAEECLALGAPKESLIVAPDAVDERRLDEVIDKEQARSSVGISPSGPVAVYAGHLFAWKGIDTIIASAESLPEVTFLLVGGMAGDRRRLRSRVEEMGLSNVRIEGHVAPGEVARYMSVADVLLLPNSSREPISARHTSPLKAFEYMAAGRPVVASDLPSIREIFDNEVDAILVTPDEPAALARGIRRLMEDPALGERLAAAAREKVRRFTWTARAANILEFARRRGAVAVGSHAETAR